MEQEQFKREIVPLRTQLMSYAIRMLEDSNDAEDIIQEVFMKLWYIRESLCQYNSIPAFSMTMTKHLCINKLRTRKKVYTELNDTTLINDNPSPHYQLEQRDNLDKVMKIIDKLPDLQQTILRMKHIEGLEIEEISELTGSSHEAIRVNLSRARKKVREMFFKIES